jgi:hypothetical protein
MACTDTWLRPTPYSFADSYRTTTRWDHLHQGDDGGGRAGNVLSLVTKPPPDAG